VRVIFRSVETDANGSVARARPGSHWVVENDPPRIRRDILEHSTFDVPCDALPATDGVFYIDMCPLSVAVDACGDTVPATGSFVIELARKQNQPAVRARSKIQVTVDRNPETCR
jgi:hypothetical protein